VHTHFNQTFTHTGRLSSSHPNLQNIPIQGEEGTRIRSTFIAEPGWKLISIDYSQIELRILAHLSQDENMMQAFSEGMDIHQMTADKVLNHLSMPAAQKRRMAKAINFGVLYGLTPFGLSKQLNISREQAKAFIDDYFGIYHGVRQYMELAIERARERGYTETLLGRRRPVAGITSQHIPTRQAEERIAMNTPVQGSAADLIKLAMIAVYRAFKQSGTRARLLLQVHDELVIESPNEEALEIAQRVSTIMTEVLPLRVPLEVSCSVADNWADAHPG
jgi:DNA polymerase-1